MIIKLPNYQNGRNLGFCRRVKPRDGLPPHYWGKREVWLWFFFWGGRWPCPVVYSEAKSRGIRCGVLIFVNNESEYNKWQKRGILLKTAERCDLHCLFSVLTRLSKAPGLVEIFSIQWGRSEVCSAGKNFREMIGFYKMPGSDVSMGSV